MWLFSFEFVERDDLVLELEDEDVKILCAHLAAGLVHLLPKLLLQILYQNAHFLLESAADIVVLSELVLGQLHDFADLHLVPHLEFVASGPPLNQASLYLEDPLRKVRLAL